MNGTYRMSLLRLIPMFGEREAGQLLDILLKDVFGIQSWQADRLDDADLQQLDHCLHRLMQGEPVQYITGKTPFLGIWLNVNPSVLIPRQETEELTDIVLRRYAANPSLRVWDIGTGSGCIAVALAYKRPSWEIYACDISQAALDTAISNALNNHTRLHCFICDILQSAGFDQLPLFDLMISNPPYIPLSEKKIMPAQVYEHEPAQALFVPDEDPLIFYRAIARVALIRLAPDGILCLECNEFNASDAAALLQEIGFGHTELLPDLQGKDRFLFAAR